jgi:PilZ domain
MQDRRSEVRMLCADMLEVHWGRHCATALLEDISPSGACLQTEIEVPVGADIHWRSPRQEFTGRVVYCTWREIGYFVGVEFAPGTKWSEEAYQPEHLLDINKLLD